MTQMPTNVPQHVAIIMDGNGRWAEQRKGLRSLGHRAGVDVARDIVEYADELGIKVVTVFAFGQENWQRPLTEVKFLMSLFLSTLQKQVKTLHARNMVLRVMGDRSRLSTKLQKVIADAEQLTANNTGLVFNIAISYSGRWDLLQAFKRMQQDVDAGLLASDEINEQTITDYLQTRGLPEPDLLIRTGGELRLSNFMLWQLAYTEYYFSDKLWPDFNRMEFATALTQYANRQRRFGLTGAQLLTEESGERDVLYG